jgi:hypothetical protein
MVADHGARMALTESFKAHDSAAELVRRMIKEKKEASI